VLRKRRNSNRRSYMRNKLKRKGSKLRRLKRELRNRQKRLRKLHQELRSLRSPRGEDLFRPHLTMEERSLPVQTQPTKA